MITDTLVNRDGPTVADWNGDGLPDLAGFGTAKTGATGVYIWLQTRERRR